MAAAITEIVGESPCGNVKESPLTSASIAAAPMTEKASFETAAAAAGHSTRTVPAMLLKLSPSIVDDDSDGDDATMQTPSASPAVSFDAGDEFASTDATTASDFGSGISITTPTTTVTGTSLMSNDNSSGNSSIVSSSGTQTSSSSAKSDFDTSTMPQWKKELLQRRKANIARTIGANQPGACSKKGTSPTTTTTMMLPTSPVKPVIKNFFNDSNLIRGDTMNSAKLTSVGSSSDSSQSGVNARTPDIIQLGSDASSGHYTPPTTTSTTVNCTCQQHYQQLPCAVHNSSPGATLFNAKPKTCCASSTSIVGTPTTAANGNSFIGNDGFISGKKCTSVGMASGTCLTSPIQPTLYRHCSQQQQPQHQIDPHSNFTVVGAVVGQPSQLHSRLDVEHNTEPSTSSSESCAIAVTGIGATSSSYIKNPTVNKTPNKFTKYKSASAKPSLLSPSAGSTIVNPSVTFSPISLLTSSVNRSSCVSNKKMVAAQELIDEANDAFDFDPSEELQYGPGIVSKLRCRYLSLALRQSAGKQRPNLDNLRRATSLNNLLDDDDRASNSSCTTEQNSHVTRPHSENLGKNPDEFVATFQKNLKITDKQRSRNIKRGNDSLKRARSVEALLVSDKSWENDAMSVTNDATVQMRYNHQQIIIDSKPQTPSSPPDLSSITSSAEVTIEDKIINTRERNSLLDKPPKRISPFMDETERPPPDVVKQTLKIFEATANRRGRGLSRNNCNGEVATKVRNYKSIISQEKPPIIFPKPPLSPKKNFRKPANLDIVAAKKIPGKQLLTVQSSINGNSNNNNNGYSNNMLNNNKKVQPNSPIANAAKIFEPNEPIIEIQSPKFEKSISPPTPTARTNIPFRHNVRNESTPIRTNSYDGQSPQTPDIIPRKIFESSPPPNSTIESPVTQLAKQIERLKIVSPTPIPTSGSNNLQPTPQPRSSESDDSTDGASEKKLLTKRVSKLALENISKAGTTQQFNFNNMKASNNKLPLVAKPATAVNGNSSAIMQSEQQQSRLVTSSQSLLSSPTTTSIPAKQIGIIRPLVAEQPKLQQTDNKLKQNNSSIGIVVPTTPTTNTMTTGNNNAITTDYTSYVDEQTTKTRDNLVISNLSQQSSANSLNNINTTKSSSCSDNISINKSKPIIVDDEDEQQEHQLRPILTSREIEKNLINMKKNEEANLESNNGTKWQLTKMKSRYAQQQPTATQNTMVFNFKDRKEVPDYIENDGLLFRRKRELPKPNEPGFVLLGDLSLETSTDPDDEWTMGPPSPCDVEFENANIVIDGKSSIRSKSREVSLRVQFDDTLTSTFEYPSESSIQDETYDNVYTETITSHIATPSTNSIATVTNTIPTDDANDEIVKNPGQKLLGSMSLGSAPLGSYIPMKAQINTKFELGVTRSATFNSSVDSSPAAVAAATNEMRKNVVNATNGNATENEKQFQTTLKSSATATAAIASTNGINNYIPNGSGDGSSNGCSDEPESLQYLKPATDDLTVAYSEGTQKTDLLY